MKLTTAIVSSLTAGATAFAPTQSHKSFSQLKMSEEPAAAAATPAATPAATTPLSDLEALAAQQNNIVKYYDPLSLAERDFWDQGNEATIGFLRQAEIKHGRIAMAAFVGYCVQSNFVWPWDMTSAGDKFPSVDLSPEDQWDALPLAGKLQIFTVIAALELWDESDGTGTPEERTHYMRGRQPGKYPSFQNFRDLVHWVPDLYDPFNLFKKMSQEKKDKRLNMEINNGRLAMIGIFGFMAADNVAGSVPALNDIAQPYSGQIMVPFSNDFSILS